MRWQTLMPSKRRWQRERINALFVRGDMIFAKGILKYLKVGDGPRKMACIYILTLLWAKLGSSAHRFDRMVMAKIHGKSVGTERNRIHSLRSFRGDLPSTVM